MGPSSAELAKMFARLADDKKAEEITILDLRGSTYVTDFFVIASGRNLRHLDAVAQEIELEASKLGIKPFGSSGKRTGRWILLDYVDVVVHLFEPAWRELYDLELLWGDVPRLDWRTTSDKA